MYHIFLEPPADDLVTNSKIFYIKVDIIGKVYLKEYDDKSSKQFKALCKQIEKEVRQTLLTNPD